VDKVLSGLSPTLTIQYVDHGRLVKEEDHITLPLRELRALLTNAWMAGLAYSLELIEPKPWPWEVRLREEPKTFEGGKMQEPILYEGCR
jgi:hypothetical protein